MDSQDIDSKVVPVRAPGPLKYKDLNEDTELYIFRIPKGLIDVNDLINEEITVGGKKPSKLTIKGKKIELVTRPLNGLDLTPWLPNSKGVLKPASVGVTGEVRARLCLDKSDEEDSSSKLRHLKPAEHNPPDLPVRNFFGSKFGSQFFANSSKENATFTSEDSQQKGKKVKTSKVKPKSSADAKNKFSQQSKVTEQNPTPLKMEKTSVGVKRKRNIEEISPEVRQKPFKRKRQDKLVDKFKEVFDDICNTPNSKEKKPSTNVEIESTVKVGSPSKKSKKSKKLK